MTGKTSRPGASTHRAKLATISAHRIHRSIAPLVSISILLLPGCDVLIQGRQRITITVRNANSGEPVQDATVTYAPAERKGSLQLYALTEDEYLAHSSDHKVVTDTDGQATLTCDTSVLRGGFAVWIGFDRAPRDEITGRDYLLGIEKGEREVVTVCMVPGAVGRGHSYAVDVRSISRPERRAEEP